MALFDFSFVNFLFLQFLFFILLFVVVISIITKVKVFQQNRAIQIFISLIVAMLAAFQIKEEMFNEYVLVPYNVLGMVLILIIPFIVIGALAYRSNMSGVGRKVIWGLYGFVMLAMLFSNYSGTTQHERYAYFALIGVVVLAIVLDKNLKKVFKKKCQPTHGLKSGAC